MHRGGLGGLRLPVPPVIVVGVVQHVIEVQIPTSSALGHLPMLTRSTWYFGFHRLAAPLAAAPVHWSHACCSDLEPVIFGQLWCRQIGLALKTPPQQQV
jgi:hypothetical protein